MTIRECWSSGEISVRLAGSTRCCHPAAGSPLRRIGRKPGAHNEPAEADSSMHWDRQAGGGTGGRNAHTCGPCMHTAVAGAGYYAAIRIHDARTGDEKRHEKRRADGRVDGRVDPP